jgi:quinohemoprotein ethanol dehydrogenase
VVPDLRRSAALTDAQAWSDIVIGGRLSDHGMIGWGRFVKAADAEAIRAYVGAQARALQQRER